MGIVGVGEQSWEERAEFGFGEFVVVEAQDPVLGAAGDDGLEPAVAGGGSVIDDKADVSELAAQVKGVVGGFGVDAHDQLVDDRAKVFQQGPNAVLGVHGHKTDRQGGCALASTEQLGALLAPTGPVEGFF